MEFMLRRHLLFFLLSLAALLIRDASIRFSHALVLARFDCSFVVSIVDNSRILRISQFLCFRDSHASPLPRRFPWQPQYPTKHERMSER